MARRRTVRTSQALQDLELIDAKDREIIDEVARLYAVSITPAMQDRMVELGDPVARQFVPTADELVTLPIEDADPIGDEPFTPVKGITHRYPDRVLLKPMHLCPVYCRFCFRREVVGPGEGVLSGDDLDAAIAYIADHPQVWEVIFTGGAPMIIAPSKLKPIMDALAAIDHIKVVRFHTRVPVVDPRRITDELVAALRTRLTAWVVVHTNHAQEIGPDAREAIARLVDGGIPLLSQSVLLRGVNDTVHDLEELFRTLVENRIQPYYLHHEDLAQGTSHFRTTIDEGQELMRGLRGDVSGVSQPTYVLDIPGGHGKVPVGPVYLDTRAGAAARVEDPWGEVHMYPPVAGDALQSQQALPEEPRR